MELMLWNHGTFIIIELIVPCAGAFMSFDLCMN